MGQKSSKVKRAKLIRKEIVAVEHDIYKDTITTIQDLWELVQEHPEREEETAIQMYNKLFSEHPEYKIYFDNLDMRQQYKRLVTMMTSIIDGLRDMTKLQEKMEILGKRHHKHYQIPRESYEHFVRAMVFAMKKTFRDDFTPRIEYCLTTLVLWVAQVMMDCAENEKILKAHKKYDSSDFRLLNDFDEFLSDRACLEYFHLHLVQQFCEENMLFFGDANEYKQIESEMERRGRAKEMVEQYISWNGPTPINIAFHMRTSVLKSAPEADVALFDDVLFEIRQIMYGHFQNFVDTKIAQVLMAKLQDRKNASKSITPPKTLFSGKTKHAAGGECVKERRLPRLAKRRSLSNKLQG